MDCCICGPMASVYRPPRNTICSSCYEGAKRMIIFLNEQEENQPKLYGLKPTPSKGIADAFTRIEEMEERKEEMNEKLGFLESLVVALEDEIHTDILIKPGTGPPIPAHRALLATRSEIFKNILASDECKAPAEDSISLPELTHEELKCLLEFLYSGSLPLEMAKQHSFALLIAADKYDIPFLKKFCERQISSSLDPSNALQVLEVSDACSNGILREQAMNSIVRHVDEVVFSSSYEEFALKNAHLSVEITRALVMQMRDRRDGATLCVEPS
ncbi:BTB/POZ domain-containing protein At3g56230-like [Typha angustifolia]|uniref:BTB/POZ domain-containing protein At3g56230-like n=1 Tax=Typha angustifolia TaxID=59011 RepID=UPI003C30B5A6